MRTGLDTVHGRADLRRRIAEGRVALAEMQEACRHLLDELDRRSGFARAEFCEDCGKPLDIERPGGPHYCIHCGGRTRPRLTGE